MKLKKNRNIKVEMIESQDKEPEPNDWDFDFSIYEQDEKETEDAITSITDKKPATSNFMSKYGASIENIQLLLNVRNTLSEKAIAVASRSGDMKDVRDFYGCINEAWALIKDIYGSLIITEIEELDAVIVRNMRRAQQKSYIPEKLYKQLLLYRDKVYMLIQRAKLGFEVEKNRGSAYQKARAGIVE